MRVHRRAGGRVEAPRDVHADLRRDRAQERRDDVLGAGQGVGLGDRAQDRGPAAAEIRDLGGDRVDVRAVGGDRRVVAVGPAARAGLEEAVADVHVRAADPEDHDVGSRDRVADVGGLLHGHDKVEAPGAVPGQVGDVHLATGALADALRVVLDPAPPRGVARSGRLGVAERDELQGVRHGRRWGAAADRPGAADAPGLAAVSPAGLHATSRNAAATTRAATRDLDVGRWARRRCIARCYAPAPAVSGSARSGGAGCLNDAATAGGRDASSICHWSRVVVDASLGRPQARVGR